MLEALPESGANQARSAPDAAIAIAASGQISLRAPFGPEVAACRALLPECYQRGDASNVLLAVDGNRIAGAAAFNYGIERVVGVRLRVVRGCRRRGIGSALLRAVEASAARVGFAEVWVRSNATAEPDAEPFLRANGYRPERSLHAVEGDLSIFRDYLLGLRERILRSGRVPESAAIVGLDQVPRAQVAALYATYISGIRDLDPAAAQPRFTPKYIEGSTVALVDAVAHGLLMCELNDGAGVMTVEARVVTPGHRGDWINCLMMARSLELAWAAGSRRVKFGAPGDNRDTLKLMRRCNGKIVRTVSWWAHRVIAK